MHVLLADQHSDVRLALTILLNKEPGVVIVGTASEAQGLLALARTTQPDIVILDSDLPGHPAADVLTSLYALAHRPKILLLSNTSSSLIQARQPKIDAVISKNDPPKMLLEKFRTLFVN